MGLLAEQPEIKIILSLAGRTKNPVLPQINHRIGGFGGVKGLADYIKQQNITVIICATHPFARKMPFNALEAAKIANIPLLYLLRPAWQAQAGDKWTKVEDHEEALSSCGVRSTSTGSQSPKKDPVQQLRRSQDDNLNIFLTVGRLELAQYAAAPQHFYVIRSIDEITEKPFKNAIYITARPPFNMENERELMRAHKINYLITKNSGGTATEAKLTAARELGIPVILINRPPRPKGLHVATATQAMEWIQDIYKT